MTIKELCEKTECTTCTFYSICMELFSTIPKDLKDYRNKIMTKAIIETAKRLTESEVE